MSYLKQYLTYKKSNNQPVFMLNIGAMDGIKFDDVYEVSKQVDIEIKGLYVEPIKSQFDQLVENLGPNNLYENAAITTYDGEIEMTYIEEEDAKRHNLSMPHVGMSSVHPIRNGFKWEVGQTTLAKAGSTTKVPCLTLKSLFIKHRIESFDIFKIDTEGHDYEIFKQLDLTKYTPELIQMEWVHLPDEEHTVITEQLLSHNYVLQNVMHDLVAIKQDLANLL